MNALSNMHNLLKSQLDKSNFDLSKIPADEREKLNIFLARVSSFYCEQDATRERLTNSLSLSSEEMDRLYKELEINTKKIIFESKMKTLGEMASGMAHEVNNPLMILLSSVEVLRGTMSETDNLEQKSNILTNIEKSIERIRLIVRGLKTFSRNSENDPFHKSPLQEIIRDTLSLCQDRINQNGITIKCSIPEDPCLVNCRPAQLTQVLVNLLNNARDAVADYPEKWIRLDVSIDADHYIVRVTDGGHGISEEIQEKIFHPFFTTKDIGLGTGLGLSISKGIIQDHLGQLFVDNTCANTCFTITLPKA